MTRFLPIRRVSHGVVDLVSTRVIQIFTLEVDLGTAAQIGQPFRKIERIRATDERLH
jgi:hypothetical protein